MSIANPQTLADDDTGLSCLLLLLGFHQTAARQVQHALGGKARLEAGDLFRMARRMGAKASLRRISIDLIESALLPAIGVAKDGSFFLLGAARTGKFLVKTPPAAPSSLDRETLRSLWSGDRAVRPFTALHGPIQ